MSVSKSSKSLLRGTGIVGSLTMVSRILGFIGQVLLARLFGAGTISDAFFIAFRLPNLLRSFVAEGALTSAFVPVFSSELKRGPASAQELMSATTSLMLVLTSGLSLLGMIFAEAIVLAIAPGFIADPEKFRLCVTLSRIMFPYIIFVSLVAMINGALNSVKVFGAAPLAQIVMNCTLIAAAAIAVVFKQETAVIFISVAVIFGGLLQIVVQFPALRRASLNILPSRKILTNASKQVMLLMLPAILGAAVYQLSIFVNSILASMLRTGSVSWLFYADRLAQLPIGVFTVALASVLLPALSKFAAEEDYDSFKKQLQDSLRYTSFCIIPVSFGIFFYADRLVVLFFERGQFGPFDSVMTALAVQALCFGLWGISCSSMVMRAFLARKDTVTPALIGAGSLILNVIFSLLLMGRPALSSGGWWPAAISWVYSSITFILPSLDLGHAGLALSTGLASTVSFLALLILLQRRIPDMSWIPFLAAAFKSILASAGMYCCLIILDRLLPAHDRLQQLYALLLGTGAGLLFFGLFSLLLKSQEIKETFSVFSRLIKRDGK